MPVKAVFQGHWRALEVSFLKELDQIKNKEAIAVITAGQSLAKHIMGSIPEEIAGLRFLPGFPALSKILASTPTGPPVPESQQIALACMAGYIPESARTAASFFEKLIEMGASSDAFSVIANSTRGLNREVLRTSDRYAIYFTERNKLNPLSPASVYAAGPSKPDRFKTYVFYGFYDLNPAQRMYVKKLSRQAEILWFSPVHPSHHWRETGKRTSTFLVELGAQETHRIDSRLPLSAPAQFAENLLTGKALAKTGALELLLCGSGTGFAKAVTDKITDYRKMYDDSEIAVIATGDDATRLADEMYLSSIPSSLAPTVRASALPTGNLLMKILHLADNRFHHRDVEKLLLTGIVTMTETPDASAYASLAEKKGLRFDLHSLRATGFPFASLLASFYENLPLNATPGDFLRETISLLGTLTNNTISNVFTESLLTQSAFRFEQSVSFSVFRAMVAASLDTPVKLEDPLPSGIAVISPEKARGIQKKALIVTGLEEGTFPRPTLADPRLPLEVKKQLQLPSPDTREVEEAFLLRQLFEAAEESICIICRNTDASGRPVAVSPFITPLVQENSSVSTKQLSDSPMSILTIPPNAPFFSSSVECQRERILFDPDNPSPEAAHSGMIGKGLYSLGTISATSLENYARDPFSFLLEKVWRIQDSGEFPVRSEPDPLTRGSLVHRCVERVLKEEGPLTDVINCICEEEKLSSHLGSEVLAEIWINHLVNGVTSLKNELSDKGWDFYDSEISLNGTVAGLPAGGRIDFIFKNQAGEFILADLKTGKAKKIAAGNLIKKNLFQLPFYRTLAIQNNFTPFAEAAYIYMEGNGLITFNTLTNSELEAMNDQFEERVTEITESIALGFFPEKKAESRS